MPTTAPLIVSNLDESKKTLSDKFQEYGYLFIKKGVSQARCNVLLDQILGQLHPHVIFDEEIQTPALKGKPFFETDPLFDALYPKIQALEEFHGFFHEPRVQQLMQIVAGFTPFVYPMKMARISTPKTMGHETPPHQDAHSHQAPETMSGIWVALHDVKASMGRLMLLPYSHKRGVRPVHQAQGVGGVQCEIYDDETLWHVSDIEQGDVIIFHACCVHKAEPNTSDNTVRISLDTRFCDDGAEVFSSNLYPHHGWRIENCNWETIYQHWQDKSLQFYWRDYSNIHGPSLSEWEEFHRSFS